MNSIKPAAGLDFAQASRFTNRGLEWSIAGTWIGRFHK
jgi:hypothetical protein